jgi:hypothetical protein
MKFLNFDKGTLVTASPPPCTKTNHGEFPIINKYTYSATEVLLWTYDKTVSESRLYTVLSTCKYTLKFKAAFLSALIG